MATARAPLTVLVLAAGQGKRMRSKKAKLLHDVAGRPMVAHVAEAARAIGPSRLVAVVGHQAEQVKEALSGICSTFVLQAEQRGTGHAVSQAASRVGTSAGSVLLILNGDLPTLRPRTLRTLVSQHRRSGAALTVVTTEPDNPSGYGRIVRGGRGHIKRIVEDADADKDQRKIREINCGVYCATPSKLMPLLKRLRTTNAQGEYYLTDAVHQLIAKGEKVLAVRHQDAGEVLGVNTRAELSRAAITLYRRKNDELQTGGVTVLDPDRTWVDPRARVGKDTVLYPDVIIEGPSSIGEDCVIRPGCRLRNMSVGRRVEVKDHSVLQDSRVGDDASVGPFAHLRPGSTLESEVKVGNFVEIKKARLGSGTKASHLSYLGDAEIGKGCNIGAGTITCNYDGETKNVTTLKRGVFIGSDVQLVAPVEVGEGAYVAAGTTVTENVPAGALAIGRSPQSNKEGWVENRKSRKRKKPRGSRPSG